jgi:hypothetical protein
MGLVEGEVELRREWVGRDHQEQCNWRCRPMRLDGVLLRPIRIAGAPDAELSRVRCGAKDAEMRMLALGAVVGQAACGGIRRERSSAVRDASCRAEAETGTAE